MSSVPAPKPMTPNAMTRRTVSNTSTVTAPLRNAALLPLPTAAWVATRSATCVRSPTAPALPASRFQAFMIMFCKGEGTIIHGSSSPTYPCPVHNTVLSNCASIRTTNGDVPVKNNRLYPGQRIRHVNTSQIRRSATNMEFVKLWRPLPLTSPSSTRPTRCLKRHPPTPCRNAYRSCHWRPKVK